MAKPAKVNYLRNKDILVEIHKSKCSYSSFLEKKYSDFDFIVEEDNFNDIFLETSIEEAKNKRLKRIIDRHKQSQIDSGIPKKSLETLDMTVDDINTEDLVFRHMTYEHIPLHEGRVKTPKKTADYHKKLFFNPFKHYIIRNGEAIEVGRSHWKGPIDSGEFCQDHGRTTEKLGRMYIELTNRFAKKGNWRGYSYREEMVDRAIEQLAAAGLSFNEAKTDNPFAYFTVVATTSFTSILNLEKKNQKLRDDLIEASGAAPSITRQIENEFDHMVESYYKEKGLEPPKPVTVPKVGFGKKKVKKPEIDD